MENILINIDTRFRDHTRFNNPGSFTYYLNTPIKNISYIRLSSIELPNLYYTFNTKYSNTSFIIISNGNQYIIQIENGNYVSEFMISAIQNLFDIINNANGTSFIISWDAITYLVTISDVNPFSLAFNNGSNSLHSLGYYLGFRYDDDKYNSDDQLTMLNQFTQQPNYYWTSNTFLDVTRDEYLFLRINDYGVIYNDIKDTSLLAKIIVGDSQYVIDNGSNFLTKMYKFKQPVNIIKFDIELITPLGVTVDMNDIDYSFTLELGQIYDSTLLSVFNETSLFSNTQNNNKENLIKKLLLLNF
jgi:hypothetical protein